MQSTLASCANGQWDTYNANRCNNYCHFPKRILEDVHIFRSEGQIELAWNHSHLIIVVLLCDGQCKINVRLQESTCARA